MESKTRLVLFDVGGTLVEPHPSGRELILRELSNHGHRVDAEQLREAEAKARRSIAVLLPMTRYGKVESQVLWGRFYEVLLEVLNIVDDGTVRDNLYGLFQDPRNWGLYSDAMHTLEHLSFAGFRLGVVSNWEDWLEDLLLALNVHSMFEVIIASGPFGYAKPHPTIFERALAVTGCLPSETVYVGDNPQDDVDGARAVGIHPILIDRRGRHNQLDVDRIRTLGELPRLLKP